MSKRHFQREARSVRLDHSRQVIECMDAYCAAHPRGPSALRRPRLLVRDWLWVALLGRDIEEGIVGIGPTIETALRAFDRQYLANGATKLTAR